MRKTLIAAAFAALGAAAIPASATPFPQLNDAAPGLTLVAQGCGPGWHRNPWGRCVPFGGAYVAPAPYVYGYGRPYRRHCWWRGGVRVCNW